MYKLSGGMKSLCEDIATAHGDRKRSIKDLKEQTGAIRVNARIFLAENKYFHKEMSKELRKGLQAKREELAKNVNALREDFRKKEKEIRADLAEASRLWIKMDKTLAAKKSKSK